MYAEIPRLYDVLIQERRLDCVLWPAYYLLFVRRDGNLDSEVLLNELTLETFCITMDLLPKQPQRLESVDLCSGRRTGGGCKAGVSALATALKELLLLNIQG